MGFVDPDLALDRGPDDELHPATKENTGGA